MGTFSIGGTAEQRSLARVNPKLVDVIRRAAESSPYNVQLFSGIRPGDPRYHGKGSAVDIVLSDPATGQEIPNLKSTVGFPIYEEFAKTARAVQQQTYPELSDTFRWGGYFGGGKGKYGSVDLMHFDLGPTAKMAGGSWETGLTPEQAKVIANLGPGQIYSGEGQRKAGPGEYANLWGRAPLQAPQDAQSAIASLIAPSGGAAIPDMPTAAMGYAPNLAGNEPPAPPMPQTASAAPPMPTPPPQWAQASGFPIDESLSGRSAQDVLMGGPRFDPRRIASGTGPIGPDMGSMLSPADVLAAGPRLRPGGAPDASMVPMPQISPFRPAMGGPNDRRPQPPMPPMRPGGAPDAASVPNPPPRAQGIPNPPSNPRRDPYGFPIDVNRPRINNPDGSFSTERTTTFDASEVGLPPEIVTVPTIVNGRQVSEDEARALFASGQNPPVQRGFDSFAAADQAAEARTGSIAAARATNGERGFPQFYGEQPIGPGVGEAGRDSNPRPLGGQATTAVPRLALPTELPADGWLNRHARQPSYSTPSAEMGNAPPPSAPPQPSPPITQSDVATLGKAMDMGHDRQWFENPFNAGQLRPQSSPPPMPAEARTKDDAYTPQTGPFFDAADPSLSLPPSWSGASAFPAPPSPIGTVGAGSTGGENFTPAPPMPMPQPNQMTGRFNDAFSPPGGGQIMDLQAAFNRQNAPPTMNAQDGINSVFGAPPVQAMPPNLAIPFAEVPRPNFDFAGPAPAAAANIASPMPTPGISRADFDARFAGGTVAPSTPKPGVTPGVVAGEMPTPAAPAPPPPAQPPMPPMAPPTPPQRPPTRQQRQGIARFLGGLLGGPIGALGGGLLGGGGGFGFGQPATFAWSGGGSAPYGNGGSTNYQTGTSNALGGSNALSWQGSKGQTVTVVENPWSPGTYLTSY